MLLAWRRYTNGEAVDQGEGVADAVAAHSEEGYVWIRLADPAKSELAELAEAFGLPHLAVEDSVVGHQRPKLERYDDTLFLVLRPAVYDDESETIALGEIHVFEGVDFCITVRRGPVGKLDDVGRRLERNPEIAALGPGAVTHAVADQVVDAYSPVVRGLERDITEIEREVFDESHQPPTERIYALMREVLDFERATSSLLKPMEDLARGRGIDVEEGLMPFFRDVADHARLVSERSDGFRELLNGALQANLSLIGLQENRDQRKISSWAAVALVPTIIGGIWGMNVGNLPFGDSEWGFPVLLVVMFSASGYLYWRFRRNDWL